MALFNIGIHRNLKLLFDNKIGLVLSGGGAKGAYQIGVFKAIKELGIDNLIKVISGSSIGALNGALFLMDNSELWLNTWEDANFEKFLFFSEKENEKIESFSLSDLSEYLKSTLKKIDQDLDSFTTVEDFLLKQDISFFSQSGLRDVMENRIDFDKISRSKIKLYSCAYNIDLLEPEYFFVNQNEREDAINTLLASACIPFVYKPVSIGKYQYMDGGIQNPLYRRKNIDKIPVKPAYENDCDIIIIVYLSHNDSVDHNRYVTEEDDRIILEIYPSQPLEYIKGTGTFDFSRGSLDDRIELGYHDAMFVIAPMMVKLLQGKSIGELIDHQNDYNERTRNKFSK